MLLAAPAAVVLAAALAGAALAARLAGTVPLLGAGAAFLAGVAVEVRLAGFVLAWLALVAGTYALSVLRVPARADMRQRVSVMKNVGVIRGDPSRCSVWRPPIPL
jgi:uncharacterized membrane protein